MQLIVHDDGQMMAEDVGLQYKEKYMKINTLALEGRTSAEIYYDTTGVKFDIFPILCCNLQLLLILLFYMTT